MNIRRYSIAIYMLFALLLVAQSTWWVIYLDRESEVYGRHFAEQLEKDRLHAEHLLMTTPGAAEDPEGSIGSFFPELVFEDERYAGILFERVDGTIEVRINPAALAAVELAVAKRKRMIIGEGSFFLILLLVGLALVAGATVREARYKRARELLLTGVTHEFKTPLASLSLYTETLERPELDPDQRTRILARMREDLERLRGMVEQVLAVARSEAPRRLDHELLDLSQEARTVVDALGPLAAESGASLELSESPGVRIRGDREALGLAMRNVIDNALTHGHDAVRVRVETRNRRGRAECVVSDDGPGIPPREQRRVFRTFYRVGDASHPRSGSRGTGLGLHLVKRNVEAMGGRVELSSAPGEGTRVTLSFPEAPS